MHSCTTSALAPAGGEQSVLVSWKSVGAVSVILSRGIGGGGAAGISLREGDRGRVELHVLDLEDHQDQLIH